MAKPGARGRAPGAASAVATRSRIVEAAIETLKRDGFAGASARAIARTGGFNQALVFYHFGSVADLLLAALDETSSRRLAAYREAVESARTLPELVAAAARIYREDIESGHIKVLAELISASSAMPELRPQIMARIQPWTRFAQDAIERVVGGSPLEQLITAEEAAYAIVALYLGMELLTHLEGDRTRADALFERAATLAPLLAGLFPAGP